MAITVAIDTYISLADAREYAADEKLSLPTKDADLESLLKRSTRLVDRKFGNRYLGFKYNAYQALYWPRQVYSPMKFADHEMPTVSVDSDGNPRDFSQIPHELGYAVVEIAAMLYNDQDLYVQAEADIQASKIKIGPIEIDESLAEGRIEDPMIKIKLILRPLLRAQTITMTRGA